MNLDNIKKAVEEYMNGERELYQHGSFHLNQGFTVFPIKVDEVECYLPVGNSIFQKVTPYEAIELAKSEYCTNSETVNAFLDLWRKTK